ncbi:poly-gamma-glutamate biosynthesis protein PgsC [Natronincola ferrireducens]|uniref:Poly-gamma-glutamate biosynthesis protein PgsC/CapC n=1 Tax=Natronincola ferrireducens TaxID=393762 RepID=A0A1G8XGL2_9FIRM|nr:poly-gamma-glutamate biosynthesis protein PgsC [Natronincola ferrireducens]SDJ89095.1 poly-gamma-glutamate biosynthesis protein PgsC/CapC [Natronincola ferrireducens]
MYGSDLYIAMVLGVILSLIYVEKTGILPAGLIVPGYIALVFDQPILLLVIFSLSFITYLIVMKGIGRITILYGRRKFAAMLVTAVVLKLAFDALYPVMPFEIFEFRGIGVVVPGLLANGIEKQGLIHTVTSSIFLSGITFLMMMIYYAV